MAHELANGGRSRVEDVDLVFVDDLPATGSIRIGGHPFEYQRCRTIGQWPVDDVGVAGNPADVRRAPVDVAVVVVENVFVAHRRMQEIAAGAVLDTLRLPRRTGCVEDKQRIFRRHDLRFASFRLLRRQLVVPDIAVYVPRDVGTGATYAHHRMHVGTVSEGDFGVLLQCHWSATANSLIGCDDRLAIRIEDAVFERLRRETAEHDRVNRADAGTGEHGVGSLGNHGHVDTDAIAFLYAPFFQSVGELVYRGEQFSIADLRVIRRVVALPDDGGLVGPLG